MGFISSATTLTLVAKLTPIGRQRLVSTNNSLISTFSLGDSDANYTTPLTLNPGYIPAESGSLGVGLTQSNSTAQNPLLKSFLIVTTSGSLRKSVESQSSLVSTDFTAIGLTAVTTPNITQFTIDRNDFLTDPNVNLFYTFGLPLSVSDNIKFTGLTSSNGGYADTTLSGMGCNKVVVMAIDNSVYGETLDGKVVSISLPSLGPTYTIYSSFQNNGVPLNVQDTNIAEIAPFTSIINNNIALLFSDNIMRPNGDVTLSWGTGFGTVKPFSVNGKQQFNMRSNSNLGVSGDTMVGVVYLDKGIIVLTHPAIVANWSPTASSGATINFNSVSTSVYQNISCIAGRGEFGSSTNPTFTGSDSPRISEVGLYDNLGNLIAVAKTDRHLSKNINEFLALNIKINL